MARGGRLHISSCACGEDVVVVVRAEGRVVRLLEWPIPRALWEGAVVIEVSTMGRY